MRDLLKVSGDLCWVDVPFIAFFKGAFSAEVFVMVAIAIERALVYPVLLSTKISSANVPFWDAGYLLYRVAKDVFSDRHDQSNEVVWDK